MPALPGYAAPYLAGVKFTDGYWQLRSGVSARLSRRGLRRGGRADSLTVYAPTRTIRQRGDTLNLPMLTVRCSLAAPSTSSRCQVGHFLGARPVGRSSRCSADPAVSVSTDVTENAGGDHLGRAVRPVPPAATAGGWSSSPTAGC